MTGPRRDISRMEAIVSDIGLCGCSVQIVSSGLFDCQPTRHLSHLVFAKVYDGECFLEVAKRKADNVPLNTDVNASEECVISSF